MTTCENYVCQREEQCDDCFLVDHLKECAGCEHYDHPATFISIETLVEQKAEVMGGLSGHQREVYRKMLEGKSVMETLDKQYWDKEAGADYRYGYDEDGHTKGDYKLNEY